MRDLLIHSDHDHLTSYSYRSSHTRELRNDGGSNAMQFMKTIEEQIAKFKEHGVYRLSIYQWPNGDIDYSDLADEVGDVLRDHLQQERRRIIEMIEGMKSEFEDRNIAPHISEHPDLRAAWDQQVAKERAYNQALDDISNNLR